MTSLAPSTDLDAFLAVPAPGTTELQATNALRPPSMTEHIVDGILDEVFDVADGPADNIPRVLEVAWIGAGGIGATLDVRDSHEAHRAVIEAARRLNVRVRYVHEDQDIGRPSKRVVGELFCPRSPRPMGKLESEARVLDIATRFEVAIERIDKPGLVGRKVLRRQPVTESFSVVQDATSLTVEHHNRAGSNTVICANDEVLGIANVGQRAVLFTTTETHPLPDLAHWSRVDFRGRQFAAWTYDRLLTRLGY